MTIWQFLAIDPTTDLKIIKRAYAVQLKIFNPEDDAAGYQLLREAYEKAQDYARGLDVDVNLFSSTKNTDNDDEETNKLDSTNHTMEIYHQPNSSSSLTPKEFADLVIETLFVDENEAKKCLETSPLLDNLNFYDDVQIYLASNLLSVENKPHFTLFVIEFFDWQNHPEKNSNSFFGNAITNLINQITKLQNTVPEKTSPELTPKIVKTIIFLLLCFIFYLKEYMPPKNKKMAKISTEQTETVKSNTEQTQAAPLKKNYAMVFINFRETMSGHDLIDEHEYQLHLKHADKLDFENLLIFTQNVKDTTKTSALMQLNKESIKNLSFNEDGSIDFYIQKNSPGKDKESNWLIPTEGQFYLVYQYSWDDKKQNNAHLFAPSLIAHENVA